MRRTVIAALLAAFAALMPAAAQEATEEGVRAKSDAIAAQIEAAKRMARGEAEAEAQPVPNLDDAPLSDVDEPAAHAAPAQPAAAEGFRHLLAIALGRTPTADEASRFAGLHTDLSPDGAAYWAGVPARWAAMSDPVERIKTYETFGAHAWCDLRAVTDHAALDAMFANDPVIAARCDGDEQAVVRTSGLQASLDDIAFTAEMTGRPELGNVAAEDLRRSLEDGLAQASPETARNWNTATSRRAEAQLHWAYLGRTEQGRARQRGVIDAVLASGEAPVQAADVFRSKTRVAFAMEDFDRFLEASHEANLEILEQSLTLNCVLSGAATCY